MATDQEKQLFAESVLRAVGRQAERLPASAITGFLKIAPADGGNPSNRLCDIQRAGCIDLFQLELRTYKPSRLLLLTGDGWARPFPQASRAIIQTVSDVDYVEAVGSIPLSSGQVRLVVAAHPQATVESAWIDQVLGAYDR